MGNLKESEKQERFNVNRGYQKLETSSPRSNLRGLIPCVINLKMSS